MDLVFAPDGGRGLPAGLRHRRLRRRDRGTLEGAARPGHFDGVATVVAILFSLVGAERAYFGQKDAQQVMVIRRMALDLAMPTEVVPCPTVREPDGLALSSRNARLSPAGRAAAPVVHRALLAGAAGMPDAASATGDACGLRCATVLAAEPLAEPEYVSVRRRGDAATSSTGRRARAAVDGGPVRRVRLIDNERPALRFVRRAGPSGRTGPRWRPPGTGRCRGTPAPAP